MSMNQVLDSSDLPRVDERSRPLKRSASVASLPTPPRTFHKRSRSRARSSVSQYDSDDTLESEPEGDPGRGYAGHTKRTKTIRNSRTESEIDEHSENESPDRKKRRTLDILPGHDEEEEDENAFWTGRGGSSADRSKRKPIKAGMAEDSSPSPAMLRYRVKAPVSPPPSRRQPFIQPARAASVERDGTLTRLVIPVTPPRLFLRAPSTITTEVFKTPAKPKATKIWPERDSPNNPFLIESKDAKLTSGWDSSDEEDQVVGEARQREETPTPVYEEKPTITYVFRGQKATFHNPLYGLAPEVIAASQLPIDHPDYEAAEACPPKKLFSVGKRKPQGSSFEASTVESIKHPEVRRSQEGEDQTSDNERRSGTESHEKVSRVNRAEAATLPLKPTCVASSSLIHGAREERERKETAAKTRLAPRDGLRAGAVFADRDEPARRAMGPLRST